MTLGKRDRKKIAEAALALAAERPWRDVTLADIAAASEVPLEKFYGGGGKLTVLTEVEAMLDRAAAEGAKATEREQSPRDRLFEAAMRRFDAMETHRAGLLSIDSDTAKSPAAMAFAGALRLRTVRWLMTVAGVEPRGAMAALEIGALIRALHNARAAWREDVHGDLSRTMSALDRSLRDLEGRFPIFKRPGAKAGDQPAEPSSAA